MDTDTKLKEKIMRRVWGVYILRRVTSPALRAGVLIGALFILGRLVSVPDIVANALQTSGVSGFLDLVYSAVVTTESAVLILATLAILLVLWFIADQVRGAFTAAQPI